MFAHTQPYKNTPGDTNTDTHVKGNVLLWVHFPIPLSLCVTHHHAHSYPHRNIRAHSRITELKFYICQLLMPYVGSDLQSKPKQFTL